MTALPFDSKLRSTFGTSAVRWLDWLSIAIMIPMGYVIYLQSKGHDGGWITMYGADVLGTAWSWWWTRRMVFARVRAPAEVTVSVVLIAGIVWEWCQRFDLSGTFLAGTKGTFDPMDIVSYALTLGLCYLTERVLQRQMAARRADAALLNAELPGEDP